MSREPTVEAVEAAQAFFRDQRVSPEFPVVPENVEAYRSLAFSFDAFTALRTPATPPASCAPEASEPAKCRANICDGSGYTGGYSPHPDGIDNIEPCPSCRPEEYGQFRTAPTTHPTPRAEAVVEAADELASLSQYMWDCENIRTGVRLEGWLASIERTRAAVPGEE